MVPEVLAVCNGIESGLTGVATCRQLVTTSIMSRIPNTDRPRGHQTRPRVLELEGLLPPNQQH